MAHLARAGRRPSLQKRRNIGGAEPGAVLEFAFLLAVNQLAVGIENRKPWNSFLQWHAVLLSEVEILVFVAHVDVYDVIIGVDKRCDGFGMKRGVEYVAVVAPVCSENENHALVILRRARQSGIDFGFRFFGRRVKIGFRL